LSSSQSMRAAVSVNPSAETDRECEPCLLNAIEARAALQLRPLSFYGWQLGHDLRNQIGFQPRNNQTIAHVSSPQPFSVFLPWRYNHSILSSPWQTSKPKDVAIVEDTADSLSEDLVSDTLTDYNLGLMMIGRTVRALLPAYHGYECKEPELGKFTLAFRCILMTSCSSSPYTPVLSGCADRATCTFHPAPKCLNCSPAPGADSGNTCSSYVHTYT
jgi:hypothetical protein